MTDDVLVQFRAANPVSATDVEGRRALPEADLLFERVVRQRPRPKRAVLIAATLLIVLALLALVAAVVIDRAEPKTAGTVACASSTDLSRPRTVTGFDDDPVEACREIWRGGSLGSPVPDHLTACVSKEGALTVVPGDATVCQALGLAVPRGPIPSSRDRFAAAVGELMDRCREEADARTAFEALLREHGRADWTVAIDTEHPPTPLTPCAMPAIDEPEQRVRLTFGPRSVFGG